MKWITRKKVKVDRVACPWLIKKFVDKDAEFMHWILMDAKVHGFFFSGRLAFDLLHP
jgi:hypothetical protein